MHPLSIHTSTFRSDALPVIAHVIEFMISPSYQRLISMSQVNKLLVWRYAFHKQRAGFAVACYFSGCGIAIANQVKYLSVLIENKLHFS